MKTLKILDWPSKKFYGETHPFYKWRKEFRDYGLHIEFYDHHQDRRLRGADYLLIHSRYFADGWQSLNSRSAQNEAELTGYLSEMKKSAGRLIWFDAADSSGSSDFPIIPYVDVFLKKQLLKDMEYYSAAEGTKELRIWLNSGAAAHKRTPFIPCPKDQLHKIKLGWNIGYNDYRYFGYKMSRLSNYLNYKLYPNRFTSSAKKRRYDLVFRGTVQENGQHKWGIPDQRSQVLELFTRLNLQIAGGQNVSRAKYWKELRNARLSISPFGWGEICYRDFETFIAGALLVKPLMDHLVTFPALYLPDETYIPVPWDLSGMEELLEHLAGHYTDYIHIARNGQECYRDKINDAPGFIEALMQNIT